MKRKFYFIITFLIFINACNSTFAQSPFKLKTDKDMLLIGSGLGLGILTLSLKNNVDPIKYEELQSLSRENVNFFDRGATYNWSPDANVVSDYLLSAVLVSPTLLLLSDNIRDDFGAFSVMYIENLFLSFAVVHIAKIIVKRKRPYAYNPNAPLSKKSDNIARFSFFSGHTTHAFSSAVFLSTVYSEYYQDSKWKSYIWGMSLLSASLTSYLRYASGDHFPTDIIVGAVVGSAIGYLIPLIHKVDNSDEQHNGIAPGYNNVITLQFVF